MYAVVRSGGKQYRVEEGALITVPSTGGLAGDPGAEVRLGDVLLIADGEELKELKQVAKASVTAKIVAHGKGEKIVVFHYKNKTRQRKTQGSRSRTTTLRITKIEV